MSREMIESLVEWSVVLGMILYFSIRYPVATLVLVSIGIAAEVFIGLMNFRKGGVSNIASVLSGYMALSMIAIAFVDVMKIDLDYDIWLLITINTAVITVVNAVYDVSPVTMRVTSTMLFLSIMMPLAWYWRKSRFIEMQQMIIIVIWIVAMLVCWEGTQVIRIAVIAAATFLPFVGMILGEGKAKKP